MACDDNEHYLESKFNEKIQDRSRANTDLCKKKKKILEVVSDVMDE